MRLIFLLFIVFNSVLSYKILVFSPATSKSHLISNGRLADELAKAGHDVTVLELDFFGISEATKSVKIARKRIINGFERGTDFLNIYHRRSEVVMEDSSFIDEASDKWAYQGVYNELCRELLERDELFEELKNEEFDGFFAEQVNLCGFGYAHALGIPRRFLITSCLFLAPNYDFLGLPMPTSTVPFATDMGVVPSYYERARNFIASVTAQLEFRMFDYYLGKHFQNKFGSNFPNLYEISGNVDVIFIATDQIIDISTVTLHNIVHVGGLGVDDSIAKIEEPSLSEMQKGELGIVYFSLGTIANTTKIDAQVMRTVLNVVKKFPDYYFLIRADKYDTKSRSYAKSITNAFISDWLPQPAILHHPRLKLFITHSGYNSVVESANAGVPLVNIPFMFDQNLNSRAVEKKGWGVRLHKRQLLTEPDALEAAITEVTKNKKYKEKALRIRDLIKSRPQSPSEVLVKTTEWAIKNNGLDELKFESRRETTWTYYNLDVLLPICWILFGLITLIIYRICKYCGARQHKFKKD
ncbi:unnamed protein product [Caenorhabditis brenneri]